VLQYQESKGFLNVTELIMDLQIKEIPVQVILDVQQFAPSEITVKTLNNTVIVEGKHEEKQDEHGFVSRHFMRRYVLPGDIEVDSIVSSLSSDGVLTVTAPKKVPYHLALTHAGF
jgi:crystallin alpha B